MLDTLFMAGYVAIGSLVDAQIGTDFVTIVMGPIWLLASVGAILIAIGRASRRSFQAIVDRRLTGVQDFGRGSERRRAALAH